MTAPSTEKYRKNTRMRIEFGLLCHFSLLLLFNSSIVRALGIVYERMRPSITVGIRRIPKSRSNSYGRRVHGVDGIVDLLSDLVVSAYATFGLQVEPINAWGRPVRGFDKRLPTAR